MSRRAWRPPLGSVSFAVAAFLLLLLSPTASPPSLEDSELSSPIPAEPDDGAGVREGSAILRWEPVPGAASYHLLLAPRPFDPPSSLSAVAPDLLHREVAGNWVTLRSFGDLAAASPDWYWTVGIERGGRVAFSAPRMFRLGTERAEVGTPIRAGTRHFRESAARPSTVRLANGVEVMPPAAKTSLETGTRYWIVHFSGAVRAEWPGALAVRGARVLAYLPDDAIVVRAALPDAEGLRSSPGVDWIAPFEESYKTAAPLRGGAGDEILDAAVLLFPGESAGEIGDSLTRSGFEVFAAGGDCVLVRGRRDRIAALAALDAVRWIEPYRAPRLFNHDCQWVVQTDVSGVRSVWQKGLRGDGMLIALCDSGLRTTHGMFRDASRSITGFGDYADHRKVVAYRRGSDSPLILFGDDAGAWYHGTHTACTIAGNDSTLGTSGADGIAPGARLFFVDAGGTSEIVYIPADLADLFGPVYEGNEAGAPRIQSNSWGALGGGAYDFRCEQVDRFVWDKKDFLLIFSNGNGFIANSVASPAASKNCIGAGGTENGSQSNQIYAGTSRGPTDDGRIKPTISAPARLTSASGAGDAAYQTLDGTSMAAPSLAGCAALARQYFLEGRYPSGVKEASAPLAPSAALLRAILVNGGAADVAGYSIPSFDIGWGRIRLEDVLYFPGEARRLAVVEETTGLLTGEVATYEVTVASANEPLEITLVWTDFPSTPAASRSLVNDLDLTVRRGGTTYRGNVYSGGVSTTGGTRDSLNVEECVLVNGPPAGVWEIEVAAASVPFGPQPFALVVTGALDPGAASLSFGAGSYGGDDTLSLRMEDADASAPIVTIRSDTESEPESLALAGSGGTFAGALPTARTEPVHGDGFLSVSHGDSIRARYFDASAGVERRASAFAWLRGPAIRPPAAVSEDDASAIIRWETDTPSDSRVVIGLPLSTELDTISSPDLVLSHAVAVPGLLPETTYTFTVSSADVRGNRTVDEGAATPYRVTTGPRADVLVVVGDPTFEDTDSYVDAFRRSGWRGRLATGAIPPLGDRTSGLRSHPAIWWQCGWEEYPPFSDEARDLLDRYLSGGARLAVVSHDAAWAFGDPTSPFRSAETEDWLGRNLKATFAAEPSYWSIVFGAANDPISRHWSLTGISYTPLRSGGAGDEIHRAPYAGTIDSVWSDNSGHGMVGLRWRDAAVSGDPDSAVWGGTKSRGATYCFEWSRLRASYEDDATRASVFDSTVQWLIGRDHPDVSLTTLAGGGTVASAPATIRWNEILYGGAPVESRRIEWSGDGGASWNTITPAAPPSPFSWNLAGVPNGTTVRVRVTVTDGGSPPLSGSDASDSDFTVAIPGNDTRGPCLIAGSAYASPDPVPLTGTAVIRALVSDSLRGGSAVVAAEWALIPGEPGLGTPMSGAWGGTTASVFDTLEARALSPPLDTIWIRAKDAAGVWGEPSPLPVLLRGDFTGVGDGAPGVFRLRGGAPNPFNARTTVRFDLPGPARTRLAVFDVSGRLVRILIDRELGGGSHAVDWDGMDARGLGVGSGIYLLRLESGEDRATGKTVLLR
jgi:hypothetical protein